MTPYYDRNGITIYCGDCLEVMPKLEPPFDAIITDLPYGTTACEWDTVIPFEPLWSNYKWLLKRGGVFATTANQPFASALVMSNPEWFRYEWVWRKNLKTNHLNARREPMLGHETVQVFFDEYGTYNPQQRRRTMESKAGNVRNGNSRPYGKERNGNSRPYGKEREFYLDRQSELIMPDTVLEFDAVHSSQNRLHPNQKPVSLYRYLVLTYTNPGELILDNTMGSGTTLVAAQNEGRRAVGIETSGDYCKIAVDRLRQPSLFVLPVPANKGIKPTGCQSDFLSNLAGEGEQ